MTYAAPLDDMRFVLNHLAGLPEIATLPGQPPRRAPALELAANKRQPLSTCKQWTLTAKITIRARSHS
jgi:Acyl-CoA dehydrogenase N terminal